MFYGSLSNENKNSTDCSKHVWKNNIKNNKLDWTSNLNDVISFACFENSPEPFEIRILVHSDLDDPATRCCVKILNSKNSNPKNHEYQERTSKNTIEKKITIFFHFQRDFSMKIKTYISNHIEICWGCGNQNKWSHSKSKNSSPWPNSFLKIF